MRAADAAKIVRTAIRQTGSNPKGMVRVRSNDYITELHIDIRSLRNAAACYVEEAIQRIPNGDFTWEVESYAYYPGSEWDY